MQPQIEGRVRSNAGVYPAWIFALGDNALLAYNSGQSQSPTVCSNSYWCLELGIRSIGITNLLVHW